MDLPADAPPLARAGEVPVPALYARLDTVEGRVTGRWRRRRDAEFEVFELADGLVVRWIRTTRQEVEDHVLDAAGRPSVTVFRQGGVPGRAVVHGVSDAPVDLAGWVTVPGPVGAITLPSAPTPIEGGLAVDALGGRLEVWREETADPVTPAFLVGLLAGSGATLADRSTVWVDGRPGVRFALLAGSVPASVWAVPVEGGTLVLAWKGASTDDPEGAWLRTRILPALVDLDAAPVEAP